MLASLQRDPFSTALNALEGARPRALLDDDEQIYSLGGSRGSIWGFLLVVLMDLEAQTLSELRSVYALSIYMGFGSRFY